MVSRKQSCTIEKDLPEYLQEIIQNNSSVRAVYLFGSFVRGNEKEQSDLDLAFLIHEDTYKTDTFEATGTAYMIATQIGRKFGRKTDAIILNSASIEIAYEVVTSGQCVYEADTDEKLEYEAVTRGLYYDFKPFLMELRAGCIAQLA